MIPSKATLIYDVEMVEIRPREPIKADFKDHDRDGDGLLSLEEVIIIPTLTYFTTFTEL